MCWYTFQKHVTLVFVQVHARAEDARAEVQEERPRCNRLLCRRPFQCHFKVLHFTAQQTRWMISSDTLLTYLNRPTVVFTSKRIQTQQKGNASNAFYVFYHNHQFWFSWIGCEKKVPASLKEPDSTNRRSWSVTPSAWKTDWRGQIYFILLYFIK